MHICVSKLTIIGSDNALAPGRRQTIIWTTDGIVLIGPLGTNFSEIVIGIQTFSFKKIHMKMSSAKWRPLCPGLNVLIVLRWDWVLVIYKYHTALLHCHWSNHTFACWAHLVTLTKLGLRIMTLCQHEDIAAAKIVQQNHMDIQLIGRWDVRLW